jgi:hypothetical protein
MTKKHCMCGRVDGEIMLHQQISHRNENTFLLILLILPITSPSQITTLYKRSKVFSMCIVFLCNCRTIMHTYNED